MSDENNNVIAVVDDLFFAAKITEAARRAGVPVQFVKDERSLLESAEHKPALIIIDLNCAGGEAPGVHQQVESRSRTESHFASGLRFTCRG